MEKEIRRQMIIGTLVAIGIFIGILAIINGLDLAATFLSSRQQTPEPDLATPAGTKADTASEEKTAIEFSLPKKEFTLYFPAVVNSATASTQIKLLNNTEEIITDTETTVIGSRGDWHRYRPFTIASSESYLLATTNLANLPADLNPGVLIITTDSPVAGIATVSNANGLENNPIPPYLELARDLYFQFDRNRDGTKAQNSLVITNLNPMIAEIQLSFSSQTPEQANITAGPLELKPWETKIFDLGQITSGRGNLADFDGLLVSGTAANFIGVIAEVDESQQTWKNLAVGEVR